jgi:hypothetical protein
MLTVYNSLNTVNWSVNVGAILNQLRTDAFYQADSESPDNAMVKMTREQGLQQARVLDHRCPEEILTYLEQK